MAGWLAWNLRIITVAAVACFSYYGADYWSSRNKHESIEKTDFKEFQESDGVEELVLGDANLEIAKSYFTKIDRGSGARVGGIDEKIRKMEQDCKDNPQYNLRHPTNLSQRRFCRLYWNVKENIDVLIETKNELMLLSSTSNEDEEGWKTAWNKYKLSDKPWGNITEEQNRQVPQEFKDRCKTESKELVHNEKDDKYKRIAGYCTRNKIVKDELKKKGFRLLKKGDSGDNGKWEENWNDYKKTTIGARFKSTAKTSNLSEFQEACEETVKFKTTVESYRNFYTVVEQYCATKENK